MKMKHGRPHHSHAEKACSSFWRKENKMHQKHTLMLQEQHLTGAIYSNTGV